MKPIPPAVRFKAEDAFDKFNNVNFARSQAQRIANETRKSVRVMQLFGGSAMPLQTMKPELVVDLTKVLS